MLGGCGSARVDEYRPAERTAVGSAECLTRGSGSGEKLSNEDESTTNDPLVDTDQTIRLTVVAEYPVFVNGAGVEQANSDSRGRATRMLRSTLAGGGSKLAAMAVQGDLEISGSLDACGSCANVHTNNDAYRSSGGKICGNSTAAGSFSGSCTAVTGECGGSYPTIAVPVINPYDDLYVPTLDTFDTSSDSSLPAGLRCPKASSGDPGANKYFALVADGGAGRVLKAYWDFSSDRWRWKSIDDMTLDNIALDDCGRLPTDSNYGGAVDDGKHDEFYGWTGATLEWESCKNCLSSLSDVSFCFTVSNDYVINGFLPHPGGFPDASFVMPGSFIKDAKLDASPAQRPKNSKWTYASDTVWSPLYGAVIWVYGNAAITGNPGESSSVDFRCSAGAGCNPTTLPKSLWQVSLLSLGDIEIAGQTNIGPANPDKNYSFLLIAGRDLLLSGDTQEDTNACGATCTTSIFSGLKYMGGIFAAHEQIQISSSGNIFGFLLAEDAIDCSTTVDGMGRGLTTIDGSPSIYYDCQHPANPWAAVSGFKIQSWQEIE